MQQLQLAAQICDQLSRADAGSATYPAEDWLAQCDAIAERIGGTFDSAADLRAIRDESPAVQE